MLIDPVPWGDQAKCLNADPDVFFPEKGGSTREAKRICASCPALVDCLEYALEHDERFGIWGGHSERERRKLKRLGVDYARQYIADLAVGTVTIAPANRSPEQLADAEAWELTVADELAAAGGKLTCVRADELGVCVVGHDMTDPGNRWANGTYPDGRPRHQCRACGIARYQRRASRVA